MTDKAFWVWVGILFLGLVGITLSLTVLLARLDSSATQALVAAGVLGGSLLVAFGAYLMLTNEE